MPPALRIAVADVGGTNARFALAEVAQGRVVSLGEPIVLRTADHAGLPEAWHAFGERLDGPLPRHAALGVAGPVTGGPVRFINSHWVVDPESLGSDLRLDSFTLVNDFGAMAHAAHALGPDYLEHLLGPDCPLPERAPVSIIGPGTGLGVAALIRREEGPVVLETEGAHIHFAPLDEAERTVCDALVAQHGRCAVERVVSGPGLGAIARALNPAESRDDPALWAAAEAGEPALAPALDLFLASYGAVAGDLSLAHGSLAVVLAGGLTNRLRQRIAASAFHARFLDKGRYRERMTGIPVKLITHPQPGLFGAAAAFAQEHAS